MKTTIMIAEDEPLMRERLQGLLEQAWPQARVVLVAENGNDAWDGFLEHDPEVVFLDIRMPGLSGLEVAERIGKRAHVVFVTAYDQYAVDAFDAGAVDYLLKPVQAERLQRTLARLGDKLGGLDPEQFWQIHRGTMVNVKAIEAAERIDAERMQVLVRGSTEKLPVSRTFTYLFRD